MVAAAHPTLQKDKRGIFAGDSEHQWGKGWNQS